MEKHNSLDIRLELPEWFFIWRKVQGEQEVEEEEAQVVGSPGKGARGGALGASRERAGKAMLICWDTGERRPLTTSSTQVPHLRTMATELCV